MVKFKYNDGFIKQCDEREANILKRLRRGDIVRDAPAPAPADKPAKAGKKAAQKAAEEFL